MRRFGGILIVLGPSQCSHDWRAVGMDRRGASLAFLSSRLARATSRQPLGRNGSAAGRVTQLAAQRIAPHSIARPPFDRPLRPTVSDVVASGEQIGVPYWPLTVTSR